MVPIPLIKMTTALRQIRLETGIYLDKFPSLFCNIYRILFPRFQGRIVGPDTDIVIEGFPRSANTFAYRAFVDSQIESHKVAHHVHYSSQIIEAVKYQIPAILLIRVPKQAILSFLVRSPGISIQLVLDYYIQFYRRVAPLRDSVVVAPFEEVTKNFNEIIKRVNSRYGTSFLPFMHTPENVRRTFRRIELENEFLGKGLERQVSRPSPLKNKLKNILMNRLESPHSIGKLKEANGVYQYIAKNE